MFRLGGVASHDQDTKCVAALPSLGDGGVVSCSRDKTARTWLFDKDGGGEGVCLSTFVGHNHFVNCCLFHPGLPLLDNEPCIITGSNDNHIVVWSIDNAAVEAVLDSHENVVKCLALLPNGDIVSGSWDSSAIVWCATLGTVKTKYKGHQNSVTCVTALSTGLVCTGSGDRTVQIWDPATGKRSQRFAGHSDAVQGVCDVPPGALASASNDGTVKMWAYDGSLLQTFEGHTNLVYSVAFLAESRELLSSSEDRSVRVWNIDTAECTQQINHPSLVWTTTGLANGDIVTGTGTGGVYLWTRDTSRVASSEHIEQFDQAVANVTVAKASVGSGGAMDTAALEDADIALRQGGREGQVKVVRGANGAEAYMFTGGTWVKQGDVVDGPEDEDVAPRAPTKTMFEGRDYDYVFDIELPGGSGHAKLPYNVGDDPFEAAQDFVNRYAELGVSQMDKELIINHILEHTNQAGKAPAGTAAPAFSAYAQEAEEMRARGVTTASSFKEQMEKMQSAGADVAYSEYAKEGRAQEQAAAPSFKEAMQRMEAAGDTPAYSQFAKEGMGVAPDAPSPTTIEDFGHSTIETFEGIKPELVEKKLREWGLSTAAAAAVGAAMASPSDVDTLVVAVDACRSLLQTSSHGNRFPAIDLLRALLTLASAATLPAALLEAVDDVVALQAANSLNAPAEQLVTARFFANAHIHIGFYNRIFAALPLAEQISRWRPMIAKASASAGKASVAAIIRNIAIAFASGQLSECGSGVDELGQLVFFVSEMLLLSPEPTIVISLLRSIVTLMKSGDEVVSAIAKSAASESLVGYLKTRTYGNADVVAISGALVQVLSTD